MQNQKLQFANVHIASAKLRVQTHDRDCKPWAFVSLIVFTSRLAKNKGNSLGKLAVVLYSRQIWSLPMRMSGCAQAPMAVPTKLQKIASSYEIMIKTAWIHAYKERLLECTLRDLHGRPMRSLLVRSTRIVRGLGWASESMSYQSVDDVDVKEYHRIHAVRFRPSGNFANLLSLNQARSLTSSDNRMYSFFSQRHNVFISRSNAMSP